VEPEPIASEVPAVGDLASPPSNGRRPSGKTEGFPGRCFYVPQNQYTARDYFWDQLDCDFRRVAKAVILFYLVVGLAVYLLL